ncbi:head fiber protein [Brucella pseudogrignonensis]|uniref:head fiber protein n=1 Tax=Brucella pseudogrignonensis TaxID=419475 RepID=UPI000B990FF9
MSHGLPRSLKRAKLPASPVATTTTAGTVKKAATQANSTATDVAGVVADLNALLAKLKASGQMA